MRSAPTLALPRKRERESSVIGPQVAAEFRYEEFGLIMKGVGVGAALEVPPPPPGTPWALTHDALPPRERCGGNGGTQSIA